jgi:hypothetical protein
MLKMSGLLQPFGLLIVGGKRPNLLHRTPLVIPQTQAL